MTFYTYLWLREDGTPYYVGKGSGRRAFINSQHNVCCPSPERIIIQEFENEQESLEAERLLISCYGRLDIGTGCLRNRTDGGEGTSGYVPPEEKRKRHSQTMRGRKYSTEHRARIAKAVRQFFKDNPKAEAARAAALNRRHQDEQKNQEHSRRMTGSGNPMFGKSRSIAQYENS